MTPRRKAATGMAPDGAMPASSLPQLCSEAADHVARARHSLYDESYDADQALLHLDEAIACLKRLLALGRTNGRATGTNGRGSGTNGRAMNGNGSRPGLRSA